MNSSSRFLFSGGLLLCVASVFWGGNLPSAVATTHPLPEPSSVQQAPQPIPQAREFYVSPKGRDNNPGTKTMPWRTPQRATQGVTELLAEAPGTPVTVFFDGGRYTMDSPWIVTAAGSGSANAPVIYTAIPGETPIFSGGAEIKVWRHITDKATLKKLDPSIHNEVYVADLRKARINNYGDPTTPGQRPELFCNGELQTLSRWPDKGFVYAPQALGVTPVPENWAHFKGSMEGILRYDDPRPNRWTDEPDVRLNGYWFWDWLDEYQRLGRIDTAQQILYIQPPYHASGYKDGLRYRALNLLCELDTPGEWYIDRAKGLLYWYPSVEASYDNRVALTRFDAPYMAELDSCSHVILRGLTFEESRGSGVLITGGESCLLDGVRISGMGRDGVNIKGGSNHGIRSCLLRQLGFSGIQIEGGDRRTLTPAGHFVENSVVETFSTFKRTYEPAVHATGCGIRIAHNRFEHSSSSAMRYEGNDILVEYNVIRDVVNESDDQGGIESYFNPTYRGIVVRYNYWSDISGGTFSGATGVRMDDMICGVEVYGNIFERCGSYTFGGVQINGGKENVIENNIFYRCPAAVSFTSMWTPEKWEAYLDTVTVVRKMMYEDVDINSAVYRQRYPELQRLHEDFNRNIIRNNLVVDCPQVLITGHDGNTENNARQVVSNNTEIRADGRGIRSLCQPDFLARYGLKPIPLDEMGPHGNPWIK